MTGRRHHQRYALSGPQLGTLEVLGHVEVEFDDGRDLVITTRAATVVGEEVTLYLADATQTMAIRARVVESRLDAVKGDALRQVRLARLEGTGARTITPSE